MVVVNRQLDAAGDYHSPGLAADQLPGQHLVVEVVHDDLGLLADGIFVPFYIAAQLALGLLTVELRIVLYGLHEPVVALYRRVAAQHIQDKALLDRLFHGVFVVGPALDLAAHLIGQAKDFQGLVLGRGGEGKVAGVGQHLAGFNHPVDRVLEALILFRSAALGQGNVHLGRGPPALAGMGLVDEDSEGASPMIVANLVQDKGELLHCGDDDLLARGQEFPQLSGSPGMAHGGRHLGKLFDGVFDLLVQHQAIRYDNHRIENSLAPLLQPHQLMGQPRNRVAFAAARRMLDQIALAHPLGLYVGQQTPHHLQLMIAGPYLGLGLAPRALVLLLHHLSVVLQDIGQTLFGQYLLPQVIGLDAIGIGRIARAVLIAQVEGQEPGGVPLQRCAKAHLLVVHGKMDHTAPKLEEQLPRIPVPLVLGYGIVDGLFGQPVFQFKGGNGQAIEEDAEVQGQPGLVLAVAQLAGDGEEIGGKTFYSQGIAGRGSAVKEGDTVGRVMADPLA